MTTLIESHKDRYGIVYHIITTRPQVMTIPSSKFIKENLKKK
jgi:hypothetical protein